MSEALYCRVLFVLSAFAGEAVVEKASPLRDNVCEESNYEYTRETRINIWADQECAKAKRQDGRYHQRHACLCTGQRSNAAEFFLGGHAAAAAEAKRRGTQGLLTLLKNQGESPSRLALVFSLAKDSTVVTTSVVARRVRATYSTGALRGVATTDSFTAVSRDIFPTECQSALARIPSHKA
jgi:hypothetical protein